MEQYAERLKSSGEDPNAPGFAAKVAAYEKRLPMMNEQRIAPSCQLAISLLLSDEQESRGRGQLVYHSLLASQRHDG